jgi:hypothetical protein
LIVRKCDRSKEIHQSGLRCLLASYRGLCRALRNSGRGFLDTLRVALNNKNAGGPRTTRVFRWKEIFLKFLKEPLQQ